MLQELSRKIALLCSLVLAFGTFPGVARATFTPVYAFRGGTVDGAYPAGSLTFDSSGNIYGTTSGGGGDGCKIGCGTIFELPVTGYGNEKVLYSFAGPPGDGAAPVGGLISDLSNNLYGTTSQGEGIRTNQSGGDGCNGYGCGTAFEFTSGGSYKILYAFRGVSDGVRGASDGDGQDPRGGLIIDASGNLYGTTAEGGAAGCGYFKSGCGIVFELSPPVGHGSWNETVLYVFRGALAAPPDGESPRAALMLTGGNLYGTTMRGGSTNNSSVCVYESCGTVFELVPIGTESTETVLYSFQGRAHDGANPVTSVIMDQSGNLDGTTLYGGRNCSNYGCGTVFGINPSMGRTFLSPFTPHDGGAPVVGLVPDPLGTGNFYGVACGTACNGGTPGKNCSKGCQSGVAFSIPSTRQKSPQIQVIYTFLGGMNGSSPTAPLVADSEGVLYGTTQFGGQTTKECFNVGCGTVFSIALGAK